MAVIVKTSKLRGGQPTPIVPGCAGIGTPTGFVMQTFGVEITQTEIIDATTTILKSSNFQGQKEGDHLDPAFIASTYSSASYNSLGLVTTDGDLVFGGSQSHVAEYGDDEDAL